MYTPDHTRYATATRARTWTRHRLGRPYSCHRAGDFRIRVHRGDRPDVARWTTARATARPTRRARPGVTGVQLVSRQLEHRPATATATGQPVRPAERLRPDQPLRP